jgi:hypothetical protein
MPSDTPPETAAPQAAPEEPKAPEAGAPTVQNYESNPFNLIRPSWEGVKLNGLAYIGLFLIMMALAIVGALVVGMVYASLQNVALTFILGTIAFLVFFYLAITRLTPATYRLQLAMARRQKMSLGTAMAPDIRLGWRLIWTSILAALAIIGGLFLLVIPGIIFAAWFSLAAFVVVDENLSGVAALRRSKQLVKNRFWDTLGALSLLQAVGILSFIPVLGTLVSLVLSLVLLPVVAIRYDQLVRLKQTHDGAGMPTSGLNYLAIILAAVAIFVSAADSARQPNTSNPESLESIYKSY